MGNTLYFTADDDVHGVELWKSDGSTAGTVLVRDYNSDVSVNAIKPLLECPNLKRVFWDFKRVGENKKANDWFMSKIDKKIIDEPYYIT